MRVNKSPIPHLKGSIRIMDTRYSANQRDIKRYATQELRDEFLIEKVFEEGTITAVYSHVDRIIVMGCMPLESPVPIDQNVDCGKDLGVTYFLERREAGVINIGGSGKILVDGKKYGLTRLDCLYIPMGSHEVVFSSDNPAAPAKFYICSTPAHHTYPAKLITLESANKSRLGSQATSNERTINQMIHPAVLDTCQLSMGCTILEKGSVWNSMPSHTHERRMEVYFYFDLSEDNVVFHLMGEPTETRHIVMRSEQAVISPSWSIHSGCGTGSYTFIWAMAGENRTFDDMDAIATTDLK